MLSKPAYILSVMEGSLLTFTYSLSAPQDKLIIYFILTYPQVIDFEKLVQLIAKMHNMKSEFILFWREFSYW